MSSSKTRLIVLVLHLCATISNRGDTVLLAVDGQTIIHKEVSLINPNNNIL